MQRKLSAILIVSLMALAIASVFVAPSVIPAGAATVPKPGIVDWVEGGEDVHNSLACNPEWLKVWTITHVSHDTTIIVQGKDAYGQDVEAKALIPECTGPQNSFPLIDVHSEEPVTFAKITAVFQQGGEHCNSFQIQTMPEPSEEWLGTYHVDTGYKPELVNGYPAEPSNPDPLKVVINWIDINKNGLPDPGEHSPLPTTSSTITIKGLDQYGNVLETQVTIPANTFIVPVDVDCHTWSTVCTVTGGAIGISYYIFTEPMPQRAIFNYKIAIDHIKVTADPKNILADGSSMSTITITLLDQDDHEVHWTTTSTKPIEINVMSTGGKVEPSLDIEIMGCQTNATTTLISDTNARIVKVSALAIVPKVGNHEGMQLTGYDLVCFDGLNSVPFTGNWPIVDIGGTGSGRYYAVFINLYKGCNLISIPVIPDDELTWDELPCASQCLISVATYQPSLYESEGSKVNDESGWLYYNFKDGVGDKIPIKDGLAYWVKAEKPCTLVISGKFLDQYDPDTGSGLPPMYFMGVGWNLVGVTSIHPIKTSDYLESLNIEQGAKLYGPIWIYYARYGIWVRNPEYLYPTEGFWLFTYDGILAP
jgi:hypothetical protein